MLQSQAGMIPVARPVIAEILENDQRRDNRLQSE
jgi:hypothetical protein